MTPNSLMLCCSNELLQNKTQIFYIVYIGTLCSNFICNLIIPRLSSSNTQLIFFWFFLQELRYELDRLLEEKITNPGVTNWSGNSKEGALLTAIIHLVTTDEERRGGWEDERNWSSSDWRQFEKTHSQRGHDEFSWCSVGVVSGEKGSILA